MQELVDGEERVLKEPAPLIAVSELAASSVNLLLRFWAASSDSYQTQLDMTKRVKERFDAEGISIPLPQSDVHLFQKAEVQRETAQVRVS